MQVHNGASFTRSLHNGLDIFELRTIHLALEDWLAIRMAATTALALAGFVLVIGAPASGKGTLCKRLAAEYGFYHLSVGDLIRRNLENESPKDVSKATETMRQGQLLETEVVLDLMSDEINAQLKYGHDRFLIDGFPRSLTQALKLYPRLKAPFLVVHIKCSKQLAEYRYLERKRGSDDADLFEKRYKHLEQHNGAVLVHYGSTNKVVEIDSEGDIESTYRLLTAGLAHHDEWKSITQFPAARAPTA